MAHTVHLNDMQSMIGETLGPGEPIVVTQEMIDTFADATGDHQWIHVDQERAKDGPFGTTIAHGFLTLSLAPLVLSSLVDVEGYAMGVNYGLNKVRFPSPVPSGSKLAGSLTLTEFQDLGNGAYQATYEIVLQVEGAEKPACVAEMLARYFTG